ncbi:MAG: S8 family serine peptidase [Betaproteobacteria bacterium]
MKIARRLSVLSLALRMLLGAALLAAGATPAMASDDPALPGEVLVKLRSTGALAPLLAKYELGVLAQFGSRPIYRLGVRGKASVRDIIAAMALEIDVLLAEPNVVNSSPESRKNAVWAIGTSQAYAAQWAPAALRLTEAHRVSTGAGVRVAVLDTGVDRAHPALAGRLLPGFDFVDYDDDPAEEGSENDLGFGHGTHVAGLVALVAPGAMIMPLRVLDPAGQGNAWVLAEALLYALDPDGDPTTDDGAHVINLSLGTSTRTRIFDAVAQLATCSVDDDPVNDTSDPGYEADGVRCDRTRGVTIVAAAGNDGSGSAREYPAAESAQRLAAVGASAANGRLADFSNYGSWVRYAAPGDRITSSVPGGGYGTWSGTSMAAPLFAGAVALLRAFRPDMKPDDIIKRMGSRSAALCGTNLRQIDAAAALRDVNPPNPACR